MTEKDTIIRLKDDEGNEYILYPATKAENIIGTFDKSKVIGIDKIDNTSDADKPISTATQKALNKKANTADLPNIKESMYYSQYDYYESEKTEYEGYSYYDGCGIFMGGYPSFYDGDDMDKPTNVIILGVNHHISGMRNILVAGTGLKRAVSDSVACGRYNTDTSDTAYLAIGKGTSDSNRSNAFRVDTSGKGYFAVSVSGTGADYAEQWEWQDGNPNSEDRVGLFVAFQGDKIRLANETDNLRKVGIVSARPAVIGDDYDDEWQGKYLTDIFGRYLTETIEEDGKTREVFKLNPDYDPEQEYVPREQRPEFDKVGTHGKLVVIDDGTCEVDGFCRPTSGGIATASEDGFYIMERIDDTHIRVYLR